MILWYLKLFEGNRDKIVQSINSGSDAVQSITEIFQGIGVKEWHVKRALEENELNDKKIGDFDPLQSRRFASTLRELLSPH